MRHSCPMQLCTALCAAQHIGASCGASMCRERVAALPSDAEAAMVGVREPPQRAQKENVAEFVARKREIFLVQMSLDTKRAEIRALQVRLSLTQGMWLAFIFLAWRCPASW